LFKLANPSVVVIVVAVAVDPELAIAVDQDEPLSLVISTMYPVRDAYVESMAGAVHEMLTCALPSESIVTAVGAGGGSDGVTGDAMAPH